MNKFLRFAIQVILFWGLLLVVALLDWTPPLTPEQSIAIGAILGLTFGPHFNE